MLTKIHQRFYIDQVADLPSSNLVIQPSNRGTAPAILYSLLHLREIDPRGIVAIFPSDHHFSDDAAFVRHVNWAYRIAASQPGAVILLGVRPKAPEVTYGWIEPGATLENPVSGSVYSVKCFWEKPCWEQALELMEQGCLWNTFVMVGQVNAFLNLFRCTLPALVGSFETIRPSLFTTSEPQAVRDLYSTIQASSFSRDVLQNRSSDLLVLCAHPELGWNDLGEPSRVLAVLERMKAKEIAENRACEATFVGASRFFS